MADLDLLRDINNSYGHLAGDAVLKGIAEIFRKQLRHYDIPARFGGEEFAILLPETPPEQALEIAERIRRAVADRRFEVETSSEPIRATISLGVAGFPKDGVDPNELIHQADLAVYRAKLQGRNRVRARAPSRCSSHRRSVRPGSPRSPRTGSTHPSSPAPCRSSARATGANSSPARTRLGRPHFLALSPPVAALVALVSIAGIGAGIAGAFLGTNDNLIGLIAIIILVGGGQALSLEMEAGSISVSAVGALAGAAGSSAPEQRCRSRSPQSLSSGAPAATTWYYVCFNVGALSLASLAAAAVFSIGSNETRTGELVIAAAGLVAGGAYFVVNTGLLSGAMALEGHDKWRSVWNERFSWLLPHYVAFGAIGGAIALAYSAIGLYGLAVFVLPLFLMRKTMAAYLGHTEKSTKKLRKAAETSDSRTSRSSRRPAPEGALDRGHGEPLGDRGRARCLHRGPFAPGSTARPRHRRELGLSQAELDLLGHAALFTTSASWRSRMRSS
jgi:diguanylate cyclase (GGDEF)-like protein